MNEEEAFETLSYQKKWKDKYGVSWCDLCDVATISCPYCPASSCNGQACDSCFDDIDEFNRKKTRVEDYLTEEEIKAYHKSLRLKKFIVISMRDGDSEVNWKKLKSEGKLSDIDCELFAKEVEH